jgi:hypothetical protein
MQRTSEQGPGGRPTCGSQSLSSRATPSRDITTRVAGFGHRQYSFLKNARDRDEFPLHLDGNRVCLSKLGILVPPSVDTEGNLAAFSRRQAGNAWIGETHENVVS